MTVDRSQCHRCLAAGNRSLAAAMAGFALAALPTAAPSMLDAQEPSAGVVLSGVVVDPSDGTTIEAVGVYLEGTATATASGADGAFRLVGVRQGPHTLSFQKAGYVERRFAFVLGQDTGVVVVGAIALSPSGDGELRCRCTVRNEMNGEPLPAALIRIDGMTIGISDPDGLVETTVMLPLGQHVLETRAIGYRPDTQLINITAPIVEIELDIAVEPTPYRLENIVVVGERLVRKLAPFYFRRLSGFGRFLEPADIEELMPTIRSTTDLLARVPGVIINPALQGIGVRMARSRPNCISPALYIDNARIRGITRDATFSVDMLIDPIQILAIEVYRGASEAPMEFGGSACGVVVIWTR